MHTWGHYQADGKVLLYTTADKNTSPAMTFSHKTSSELPPILKKLAQRYSPVRNKNSRVFVLQDDMWDIRGRFSDAMQDDTALAWDLSPDGKFTLSLRVVSIEFQYYYLIFCI